MVHGELKPLKCFQLWHHNCLSGLIPPSQELWPCHLSMILVRANAGAIPMRSYLPSSAFNDIILDL